MPQIFPSDVLFLRRSEPEVAVDAGQEATESLRPAGKPSTSVRDVVSRLRSSSDVSVQYVDLPHAGGMPSPHFLAEPRLEGESRSSIPAVGRGARAAEALQAGDEVDSQAGAAPSIRWPSSVLRLCEEYRPQWRRLLAMIGSHKVVGVLGLQAGCGTTTVAATIARMLSSNGEVRKNSPAAASYLIDGNLRNPTLSHNLQTTDRWPWTDWQPDNRVVPTLPADGRLAVWALTCAIFDPTIDTLPDGAANSISYYLPRAAAGPVVSRLFQLLGHVRQESSETIVDLGDCDFWNRLGFLERLASVVDTFILVVPSPLDRREVSIAFWQLQQAGVKSLVIVENI